VKGPGIGVPPLWGPIGGPYLGPNRWGHQALLPVSQEPEKNVPDYFSVLSYLAQNALIQPKNGFYREIFWKTEENGQFWLYFEPKCRFLRQ